MARPFAALRQIRAGQFHGYSWDHGRRVTHILGGYRAVETLGEALTLWGKHLVADLAPPMSLHLRRWTALYQLPSRQLREFAHQTYDHSLNTRSRGGGHRRYKSGTDERQSTLTRSGTEHHSMAGRPVADSKKPGQTQFTNYR